MKDASGQIVAVSTVARDVTERKRAEEETARLASFPILNPVPIVEVDMDGRVSFVNPAAQRLFPDLEQRGLDHPWLADVTVIVGPGHADAGVIIREVTVDERDYQQSLHYVSAARRIRIYGLDITDRKRMERHRQAAIYTRSLIEVSLDPLVTIGPDGKITDVNKATEEATGVARDAPCWHGFLRLLHRSRRGQPWLSKSPLGRRSSRLPADYPPCLGPNDGRSL